MRKYFYLILVSIFILPLSNAHIYAQDLLSEPTMEQLTEKVSVKTASEYLKSCQNNYRKGFTPKSHDNYCNCTAATIRGEMTADEFNKIQSGKANKAGDKAYEKYITKVVVPCMTIAVPDIAYVECLEHRGHNPYITSILQYCECVSDLLSLHVGKSGAAAIIVRNASSPKNFKDPALTLLGSSSYITEKYDAQRECTKRAKLTNPANTAIYGR